MASGCDSITFISILAPVRRRRQQDLWFAGNSHFNSRPREEASVPPRAPVYVTLISILAPVRRRLRPGDTIHIASLISILAPVRRRLASAKARIA